MQDPSAGANAPQGSIDSPYPLAIFVAVFSALLCLLLVPPLVWHSRNRNIAGVALVIWTIIPSFMDSINSIIWSNDDTQNWYNGHGLCDVEVKLIVAISTGHSTATMCILRDLANVLNTERTVVMPTKSQRQRAYALDVFWCLVIPIITMIAHVLVQPNRFYVFGISGCTASSDGTWVSLVLLYMPPLLFTIAAAFYAVLTIHRLRIYRQTISSILEQSRTTRSRFLRLFILSVLLVVVFVPVQIYVMYTNRPQTNWGYSWSRNHEPAVWSHNWLFPSGGELLVDTWLHLTLGALVFIFLGVGRDAKAMYRSWLLALGFDRLFSGLRHSRRSRQSTSRFSFGSRVKLFSKVTTGQSTATTDSRSYPSPQNISKEFGPNARVFSHMSEDSTLDTIKPTATDGIMSRPRDIIPLEEVIIRKDKSQMEGSEDT